MKLKSLAAACALLASACDSTTDPYVGQLVTVLVSSNTISANAPTYITTTIGNASPYKTQVMGYGCPQHFRVQRANGEAVTLASITCASVAYPPITLAPGSHTAITTSGMVLMLTGRGYRDNIS